MSAIVPPPIIGESLALRRAVALLERFAATGLAILLIGATGTGKELFAQHVHYRSGRRGELVDVDCGALPRDLVEGLLFGARRGTFTGAVDDRCGLIEQADQGTLFLDELSSLPEDGQRKLLRVLDTREVRRLGETRKRAVDVRIVAAMQDEVAEMLRNGTLRRDLYERVSGVMIQLPPLAERPEDIGPLAQAFAQPLGQWLDDAAQRVLEAYAWPGNVRELRKVIARAGSLVPRGTLSRAAIAEAIALGTPRSQYGATLPQGSQVLRNDQAERERLTGACRAHDWDTRRAAAALGISRATLYRKLRGIGISLRALRAQGPHQ